MALTLQFVDQPSTSATVRYDFNSTAGAAQCYPLQGAGLDLGVPTFDGQPGGVGGYYGYRQQAFTQRVNGSRAVALAKISALSKELLRPTNWLRLQWASDVSPVYFKTYAGEPGALSLENAHDNAQAWDITCPLTAEGFAYGARVTMSAATITQAPSGTNPMRLVLPTIKGDAPTNLRVSLQPNGTAADNGVEWLIGCCSDDGTMSDPVIDIGTSDGLTAGTNTGAGVSNAAYFNGSYRQASIAVSDAIGGGNLATRISGTLPTLTPGRYKVLLRAEIDNLATSRTYIFRFDQTTGGILSLGAAVPLANPATGSTYTRQGWIDLGDYTLPFGYNPAPDVALATVASTFNLNIGLADNTAATIRIDALKLVPVAGPVVTQASTLRATYSATPLAGGTTIGYFDGDSMTSWETNTTPVGQVGAPALAGGFPVVDPNAARNLLTVMAYRNGLAAGSASSTTGITGLNQTCSMIGSYYPRYLYMGDGT